MRKKLFLVDATQLEYSLEENILSNSYGLDAELEGVPSVSYLDVFYGDEIKLPIEIFASNLTPLQAIVKYCKEQKGLSNSELSKLIGRDIRTVWTTYNHTKKVSLQKVTRSSLLIPLSIFKDENLSALEALVSFLKNFGYNYAKISRMISKDQRTIWTVHSRAKKKESNKDEN
jgi:hypothetical protein